MLTEKETTLLRSLPPQAQGKTYGGLRHRTFWTKLGIAPHQMGIKLNESVTRPVGLQNRNPAKNLRNFSLNYCS
ncbi:hypothetical protein [Nostoc sp.]